MSSLQVTTLMLQNMQQLGPVQECVVKAVRKYRYKSSQGKPPKLTNPRGTKKQLTELISFELPDPLRVWMKQHDNYSQTLRAIIHWYLKDQEAAAKRWPSAPAFIPPQVDYVETTY